jgi:CRP-like cAMP-binding protein
VDGAAGQGSQRIKQIAKQSVLKFIQRSSIQCMKEAPMNEKIRDPEAMVAQYLTSGQNDKAFALLYKLAVLSAKKRDFAASETFRDRLYEIDSMALSKIVEINEIIEAEKNKAIPTDDRKLWSHFFEGLTANQANDFFLALRKEIVESETLILEQGRTNDRLFFVDQGQISMFYGDREKELLIARLGGGDIFGEDTFFSVNVCTASVKALTRTHLRYIDKTAFEKLKAIHDALETKLKKVCVAGRSVFNRLRQKGIDRRSFRRINLNTKISFQLLASGAANAAPRSVRAELWDISKGGLSFYFQSKNPHAVQSLVGQNIGVRFDLNFKGTMKTVALSGVAHGVQSHPLDEYSVHLKFNRQLSDATIRAIERIANANLKV